MEEKKPQNKEKNPFVFFRKKKKNEFTKVKIDLKKHREFSDLFVILDAYDKKWGDEVFLRDPYTIELNKKIDAYSQKIAEIAKACPNVDFSCQKGEVKCFTYIDGQKTFFTISDFKKIESYIHSMIALSKKNISEYNEKLAELYMQKSSTEVELENLKVRDVQKFLGFIPNPADTERAKEEYTRRESALRSDLRICNNEIKSIEENKLHVETTLNNMTRRLDFVNGLSTEEKEKISMTYNEISEINKYRYEVKKEVNGLYHTKPNLDAFMFQNKVKRPYKLMEPLIDIMVEEFKRLKRRYKIRSFSQIKDYIDFGEYDHLASVLNDAIANGSFDVIKKLNMSEDVIANERFL